jgi:gas vesicle protein
MKKGLTVIGYFCWWNIRNVKIKKEAVAALLKKYKIDYEIEYAPVRCLFSKAIDMVKIKHQYKGLLVRKINKTPEEYLYGLVDESIDPQAEALEYYHAATMSFCPQTGELTVDRPHKAFDLIVKAFEEYDTYFDSTDIRDIILDLVKNTYSINVRDRGGVYFIPAKFEKEVEALEKFVKGIGNDCYFAAVPQIDLDKTKRSLHKAFSEEMKERVEKFTEELNKDTMRTETLEKRLEEYKALKDEMQFYGDALAFQSQDILKELDTLRASVTKRLSE